MEDSHYINGLINESWHSFEEKKVFDKLDASKEGLGADEAGQRLNYYGKNKLPSKKRISLVQIILHQVISPLIFILVAAAVASLLIGEGKDAIFIFLVIFINSGLGAYQEYNAEKSASGLQRLLKINARVKRGGQDKEIPSEQLVPGDIVFLESGVKVPADMRLIDTSNLSIDESFLTGESVAAAKSTGMLRPGTGVSERTNIAYAGSTVISGRGMGVVIGTGEQTQVGLIAKDVAESESAKPPLVQRMERFIKQISIFIIVLSVVLAVILRYSGMDMATIFFFIVALAVSAIPEGLPVALTVTLSIATKRMAKRNVIVRKLHSVESLGSCTVIASDKTGTLTVNEQTARMIVLPNGKSYSVSGEGYNGEGEISADAHPEKVVDKQADPLLSKMINVAVMANEGSLKMDDEQWHFHGDAMDVALLAMSYKSGVNPEDVRSGLTMKDKIPYESENKYSAAFWKQEGQVMVGLKGAVERVLDFCTSIAGNENKQLDKASITKQAEELAAKGYRVLGFAGGVDDDFEKKTVYEDDDIPGLTFFGLVCFIDPLRKEAKTSVERCKKAGIKVIMITGDHPSTAGTIAGEIGIAEQGSGVVTGQMLQEAGPHDSPAYKKLVASSAVFARVSPSQKLEIVGVLIRQGEFVAVTGDGVNDAPALKRANIGVAMGSGTDVAKEVGAMIVVDDNFSSIVSGVEEGRFAYDNVRKVVYLLISTGTAEIILFVASVLTGMPLPLLAVQLLWLNLVTNGIQDVALAYEGGEAGAMQRKPRQTNERIFNPLMIKQTLISGLTMGGVAFGLWFWINNYQLMPETHARNIILLLMVLLQNFHAFNCRSEYTSVFKVPLKKNIVLVYGVLAAQALHIISMQIPFMQHILRVEPITFFEWSQVLLLAIPVLLVMEAFKWFTNKL